VVQESPSVGAAGAPNLSLHPLPPLVARRSRSCLLFCFNFYICERAGVGAAGWCALGDVHSWVARRLGVLRVCGGEGVGSLRWHFRAPPPPNATPVLDAVSKQLCTRVDVGA
jgi:hypothetical protein